MRTPAASTVGSRNPQGNLPADVSSFVGRQRELADVKALLLSGRLATVTGPGGVGKTRLALRVATDLRGDFKDGVWLADLAGVSEAAAVPAAVAAALRLGHRSHDHLPVTALCEQLSGKNLLLVLDTCEHLTGACALLAYRLLRSVPGLAVLAAGRQSLGLPGEHPFVVSTMAVPPLDSRSVDQLTSYDASALFLERAAGALPGYLPGPHDVPAVAELCQRLDGLPLAIELAAGRLRVLSVPQMLERADCLFDLLSPQGRATHPRRQAMRLSIDRTWDLCSPPERILWAALSRIPGGFDLEAAEAIIGTGGITAELMLDAISGLIDKSVLARDGDWPHSQYQMSELLRQYAAGRSRGPGEDAPSAAYPGLLPGEIGQLEADPRSALARSLFSSDFILGAGRPARPRLSPTVGQPEPRAGIAQEPSATTCLSAREREVAELIAEGLSNREIGAQLVISVRTVESHVNHILGKMAFRSRAAIATWVASQRRRPN
jgi:predicted ATPase/DNA-binding CsgD family transcriptional regulator